MPDPFAPNCFNANCLVDHTVQWRDGVLSDLGALPGSGNSSGACAINDHGWVAGGSLTGAIDPGTGLPVNDGIIWKDGQLIDLGTFGGQFTVGITLNNAGQVVGFSLNTIPDPYAYALFLGTTQSRAILWQDGVLQDLGTLGTGNDAVAFSVNDRGQVAGVSYTNATPNPTTGLPTMHPFVWDHGTMTDLGTLGGTEGGEFLLGFESALLINNRGQVMGTSTLAGDQVIHPFLWSHGVMTDLGTLGGDNGAAIWLSDTSAVVGDADLPNSPPGCQSISCVHHAFFWKRGVMTDLGTLGTDQCSRALSVNSKDQVVGDSIAVCGFNSSGAFLWENGGPIIDLNTLIPTDSRVFLYEADNINERGEILASGLPPGCNAAESCGHVYLLTPSDEDDVSGRESTKATAIPATSSDSRSVINPSQSWFRQRYRMLGQPPALRH
jgi:probable HAF family extracellular repeat protein